MTSPNGTTNNTTNSAASALAAAEDEDLPFLTEHEWPAVLLAIGLSVAMLLAAIITAHLDDGGSVIMVGIAAGCLIAGFLLSARALVAIAALSVGIGALIAAVGASTWGAIGINAAAALLILTVMAGADLSFLLRRGSDAARDTVRGFTLAYATAWVVGCLFALVVAQIVTPLAIGSGWFVAPLAILVVGLVGLSRLVWRYRARAKVDDQPYVAASVGGTHWR